MAAAMMLSLSSCNRGGEGGDGREPAVGMQRSARPDSAATDSTAQRSGPPGAQRGGFAGGSEPSGQRRPGAGGDAANRMPQAQRGAAAVPVEVARVSRRDMTDHILASTTLEALRQVEIFAKTSGIVKILHVEEGDAVSSGDTLVILDDREARLNLRRSEIAYREAQNALNRSREMHAKSLISQQEFETAQLAYEGAKTNLDEAELQLEYTRVTAPIDGTITARMVELGSTVTQGTVLFHLADFTPLRARIYIPEREIRRLKVGQNVLLEIDSEPGRAFSAEIELISSVIDPSSGTFKVTVTVKASSGHLRPGMFASAKIVVDTHEDVLAVPIQAILYEGDNRYLYVVREGAAQRVDVETRFTESGFVELSGAIEEGELVVITGQNNLASGSAVEIVRGASTSGGTDSRISQSGQGD
jgi:membrane fusion protein (multidrug efflux system)